MPLGGKKGSKGVGERVRLLDVDSGRLSIQVDMPFQIGGRHGRSGYFFMFF